MLFNNNFLKLFIIFFVIGVFGGVATGQNDARAEVVCGGLDAKGNWIGACGFKKAENLGKPAALKCPAGSFLDLKGEILDFTNSAECWSCPKGFRRTATHVEAKDACIKVQTEDWKPAQYRSKVKCKFGGPPEMFWDGYKGGGCWSCPPNTKRSLLPVYGAKACYDSKKWYSAKNVGGNCGPGEFFDPRNKGECWACPSGYKRRAVAVTSKDACFKVIPAVKNPATFVKKVGCPKGAFFDPIDGGTCWKCPAYYSRALTRVDGDKACRSMGFEWKTPDFNEPGLFAYSGIGAMANSISENPEKVDEFLRETLKIIEFQGKDPGGQALENVVMETWKGVTDDPGAHPAFNAMMFFVLQDAIANPDTPEKKAMVDDFMKYIQSRRTFLAQDALNAYDAWYKAEQWKRGNDKSLNTAGLGSLFDYGTVPPDFTKLTQNSMSAASKKAGAMITMGTLTGIAHGIGSTGALPAFSFVQPNAIVDASKAIVKYSTTKGVTKAVDASGKLFRHSFKIAGNSFKIAGKGIGASSKFASFAAASAGPLTIITTSATIAFMAIEDLVDIEKARPRLEAALKAAKTPLTLQDLQSMGSPQHAYYWALMTSNFEASRKASKTVQANLRTGYDKAFGRFSIANVTQIPGNARDVAVATDGTAWIVGMDRDLGGYTIWSRGPKDNRWTQIPGPATRVYIAGKWVSADIGGATRIAVAGNRVFIINEAGEVFLRKGTSWESQGKPGAKEYGDKSIGAQDIGASNAAIYVVGGKKVAGGYEVFQWKGSGNWRRVPAGAVRVDVDANGDPWVVNDQGAIFAMVKGAWRRFGGQAKDIAVHEPGQPIVAGWDGNMHVFDKAGNKWAGSKFAVTNVAVLPGNAYVWFLGPKNEIFRFSPNN